MWWSWCGRSSKSRQPGISPAPWCWRVVIVGNFCILSGNSHKVLLTWLRIPGIYGLVPLGALAGWVTFV